MLDIQNNPANPIGPMEVEPRMQMVHKSVRKTPGMAAGRIAPIDLGLLAS
jgi:hypothetical protein